MPLPEIHTIDWPLLAQAAQSFFASNVKAWLSDQPSVSGVEILLFHSSLGRYESVLFVGESSEPSLSISRIEHGQQLKIVAFGETKETNLQNLVALLATDLTLFAQLCRPVQVERLVNRTPVIIYHAMEMHGRWILTSANHALASFFGEPLSAFIGAKASKCIVEQVHPDDLPQLLSSYDLARATTRELTLKYRLRDAHGDYVPVTERVRYASQINDHSCTSVIWPQSWDEQSSATPAQLLQQIDTFVQDINFDTGLRFLEHLARRISTNPQIQAVSIMAQEDEDWWETRVIDIRAQLQPLFVFQQSGQLNLRDKQWNKVNRIAADTPEALFLGQCPYFSVYPLRMQNESVVAALVIGSSEPIHSDEPTQRLMQLFGPRVLKEILQLRIAEAQEEQNQRLAEQKQQLTGMVYMLGQLDTVDSEDTFISTTQAHLQKIFPLRRLEWVFWSSEGWWLADPEQEGRRRWFDNASELELPDWVSALEVARYSGQVHGMKSDYLIFWPVGPSEAGYLVMVLAMKRELPDLDLLSFSQNALSLALSGLQQRENLRFQAMRDSLTGLGNRAQLHAWMKAVLPVQQQASLLLFDLNRFKEINDSFGHQFGDKLLQQIGPRISATLADHEHYLSRLGGDEFALFLPNTGNDRALRRAEKIHNELAQTYLIDGLRFQVEASVGVAHYPEHGEDGHELLRCADVAMYAAKSSNRHVVEFQVELDNTTPLRIAVLSELDQALEDEQLWIAFQPLMDTKTGLVAGMEALVRWDHPVFGPLSPSEFIPIAEMGEGIRKITDYVMRQTLQYLQQWRTRVPNLHAAINISPQVLLNHQFPLLVREYLAEFALPGNAVVFELTESTLLVDPVRAVEIIKSLGLLGIQVEIDDFGTGYSSLSYLKSLPISALKIDQSFVKDILNETHNEVIVASTVQMAHSLGLKIVAEGVEDEATLLKMMRLGCDMIQGFYYAKPIPASDVDAWLTRNC